MLCSRAKPYSLALLQGKVVDHATKQLMKSESQASLSVPTSARIATDTSDSSKANYEILLAHIGERVSSARRKHKWTQQQLALQAGCALATVFLVENGKRNVTIKNLLMLCDALTIHIRDLFPCAEPSAAWDAQRASLAEDVRIARAALTKLEDRLREFDLPDAPSAAP